MNDQEINIKIAEACGFIWTQDNEGLWWWLSSIKEKLSWAFAENKKECEAWALPDYCNDLNAMHEAENCYFDPKSINHWDDYAAYLEVDSTAKERAEAFIKTIE